MAYVSVPAPSTVYHYTRGGHFEWTGPVILFVCLVFVLLAPNYVWTIIGL